MEVLNFVFDYSKLVSKIKKVCGTLTEFSKRMNISMNSLGKKLSSKRPWKQGEIVNACDILGLQPSDIPDYFFTIEVQ